MDFPAAVIMQKMKWMLALCFCVVFLLAGCAAGDVRLPTIVPLPSDTPSITLTPSAIPLPTNTLAPTPTLAPTLTPTPAPVTYTVTDQDDMFGVSLRFGVSLDALKAANPSVIPNLMSVGTILIIPITPTPVPTGSSQSDPTTTPDLFSPLRLASEPVCYPEALGGAYCFVQIENISDSAVENPTVRFSFTNNEGVTLEMDGILPLNVLPAQTTIPAVAYFPPLTPAEFDVAAQITDWLPVMEDDSRYLAVEVVTETTNITPGAGFAEAAGSVRIPEGQAEYVWVLGVVYDGSGQVLGLRRWEPETSPIDGSIPFSFRVYAIQGEIADLKLFVEAHAITP